MRIGLDFDNTIVCYDKAIQRLADERLDLPLGLPRTKVKIRDFLRRENRESEWTIFQGLLYGPGMHYAEPFDYALDAIDALNRENHSLFVISHRSKEPYLGPPHNLHEYARAWAKETLVDSGLIPMEKVFFFQERRQKIEAIRELACKAFMDDLPEVLGDRRFPQNCQAILFMPEEGKNTTIRNRISHWSQLQPLVAKLK